MKPIDKAGLNGMAPRVTGAGAPVNGAAPVRPARSPGSDAAASVALSSNSAGETPPADTARVQEIRKAVEQGRYPVVPARIADAMIAAGYLLRKK